MSKMIFWSVVGGLVGLILMVGLVFSRPYTLRGSVIEIPQPAPEISLPDTNGNLFSLHNQSGKLVLIFFGFTNCKDVCPATLAQLKVVRQRLVGQADQVSVVFISVDPQRDTPEKLGGYLAGFDPHFIGLTAPEDQLQPVWKDYGVARQIQPGLATDNYEVIHSPFLYLIDRKGRLLLTYSPDTSVDDIVQDARYLLKE